MMDKGGDIEVLCCGLVTLKVRAFTAIMPLCTIF